MILVDGDFLGNGIIVGAVVGDVQFTVAIDERQVTITIQSTGVTSAKRNQVAVEDIVDSGVTLDFIRGVLMDRGAASIRIAALLDKPARRKVKGLKADYVCFDIPDEFVVGYGLDFSQKYRNLPDICALSPDVYEPKK